MAGENCKQRLVALGCWQGPLPKPVSSSQHPEPGLEHFYAAFVLGCSRNLRTSSARAFGIKEDDISEDCSVASAIAHRLQPLQHGIPCETHVQKKAKTTPPELEVQQVEEQVAASSPNCSDSDASSSSQSSSTAEAGGVESDLEDLEEHYYSNLRRYSAFLDRDRPRHYNTQQLNAQEWAFSGGRDGLQRFLSLPTTWPLDSCFPYETWWSKWKPYFKPIVLRLPSLVRRLGNKVHMSDEWPYISGNTWPSFWLRLSLNSFKNSSHTLPKVWWMRQMQHYSRRSSGSKPSTQSCCVPPAVLERWERRSNNGHPMAWSRSSAFPLMEQLHRSMAVEKLQMQDLKRWLDEAAGLTPYLFGSLQHGCLLLLMLCGKKVAITLKVSVSWALLPLLTDHRLSYRRH